MQIPLCSFSACNAFAHVYVMSASRPTCESAYLNVVSREHFSGQHDDHSHDGR